MSLETIVSTKSIANIDNNFYVQFGIVPLTLFQTQSLMAQISMKKTLMKWITNFIFALYAFKLCVVPYFLFCNNIKLDKSLLGSALFESQQQPFMF